LLIQGSASGTTTAGAAAAGVALLLLLLDEEAAGTGAGVASGTDTRYKIRLDCFVGSGGGGGSSSPSDSDSVGLADAAFVSTTGVPILSVSDSVSDLHHWARSWAPWLRVGATGAPRNGEVWANSSVLLLALEFGSDLPRSGKGMGSSPCFVF